MTSKAYRDAVSGEYVTAEYAAEHPDTTVAEEIADADWVDPKDGSYSGPDPADADAGNDPSPPP